MILDDRVPMNIVPNCSADELLGIEVSEKRKPRDRAPIFSKSVSFNFSLAKVIAIFTVVTGHWFSGTILWIPVTFGLFVFAFSSAYFTARIYGLEIDRRRFWRKKLERLGLRYWIILFFLSIMLVFEGKTVLHWHTLVHFFGLSGILNWLAIPNRSALGAGLWFFTLLLIFYAVYPFLVRSIRSRGGATAIAVVDTIAAIALEQTVKVGHELWLTSLGFVLGTVFGLHEPRFDSKNAFVAAVLSCACLLGLNLLGGDKHANPILIAAASISISLWLLKAKLPRWHVTTELARLENCLLEIFIIHTYLFLHVLGNSLADFIFSFVLTLLVSVVLHRIAAYVSSLLLKFFQVLA